MAVETTRMGGIHHLTAMAGDPQRNINFYTRVLGQRLVKQTVNFDDPATHHFYYGDAIGSPGSVMTFFPWPKGRRGRIGAGEVGAIAYAVPAGALSAWRKRLTDFDVPFSEQTRFGDSFLQLSDPDDVSLELVESDTAPAIEHWTEGPVPAAMALRGFAGVTLQLAPQPAAHAQTTQALLTDLFGFTRFGEVEGRERFVSPAPGQGAYVDIISLPTPARGVLGTGSVHHIAFRAPDDQAQLAWRQRLLDAGLHVTEVRDRQYFHSIYFREPGGVLFEIATDSPGFMRDEDRTHLGAALKLPPWLEPQRAEIEAALPPIDHIVY